MVCPWVAAYRGQVPSGSGEDAWFRLSAQRCCPLRWADADRGRGSLGLADAPSGCSLGPPPSRAIVRRCIPAWMLPLAAPSCMAQFTFHVKRALSCDGSSAVSQNGPVGVRCSQRHPVAPLRPRSGISIQPLKCWLTARARRGAVSRETVGPVTPALRILRPAGECWRVTEQAVMLDTTCKGLRERHGSRSSSPRADPGPRAAAQAPCEPVRKARVRSGRAEPRAGALRPAESQGSPCSTVGASAHSTLFV